MERRNIKKKEKNWGTRRMEGKHKETKRMERKI